MVTIEQIQMVMWRREQCRHFVCYYFYFGKTIQIRHLPTNQIFFVEYLSTKEETGPADKMLIWLNELNKWSFASEFELVPAEKALVTALH
jgi:hypothetical protein